MGAATGSRPMTRWMAIFYRYEWCAVPAPAFTGCDHLRASAVPIIIIIRMLCSA